MKVSKTLLRKYGEKPLNGKVCLLTGFTSGIGRITARELAGMGATMILVARHSMHGETVKNDIRDETGNKDLFVFQADLSSLQDIRVLAEAFKRRFQRLDILINNAGLLSAQRMVSKDGFELTFAVNHLAPFLLTRLLLDVMDKSAPARIINVASDLHRKVEIDFEDLMSEREYNPMKVYSRSKLANVLFTRELAARLGPARVTANSLHPGTIATDIVRDYPAIMRFFWKLLTANPQKGARTTIHLASSPDLAGVTGAYFAKEQQVPSSPYSQDSQVARRLWETSERLCGLDGSEPPSESAARRRKK